MWFTKSDQNVSKNAVFLRSRNDTLCERNWRIFQAYSLYLDVSGLLIWYDH